MRLGYKILQKILLLSTVLIITGHQLYSHSHNTNTENTSEKCLLDIFLKVLKENHSNTYLEEYTIDTSNLHLLKIFIAPSPFFLIENKISLKPVNNNNILLILLKEKINSIFGRAPPFA